MEVECRTRGQGADRSKAPGWMQQDGCVRARQRTAPGKARRQFILVPRQGDGARGEKEGWMDGWMDGWCVDESVAHHVWTDSCWIRGRVRPSAVMPHEWTRMETRMAPAKYIY